MKRILSFCAVLLLMLCNLSASMPVSAAATAAPTVTILKYDSASKKYISASKVQTGDVLLVQLGFSGTISSLAALRIKLSYSGERLSYTENSATPLLKEGSPLFNNKYNSQNPAESYLLAYWSTDVSASNNAFAQNVSGSVATFLFTCDKNIGVAAFRASVLEIRNQKYQPVELAANTADASVTISKWQTAPETQAIFQKMLHVTYPDSKTDIETADAAYKAFSAAEKTTFKNTYPDLFSAYSTAWQRYYDLARAADENKIKQELQTYLDLQTTVAAMALTPKQVNETNYQTVFTAYKGYQNLSSKAAAALTSAQKDLLFQLNEAAKKIQNAVEEKEIADSAAEDFIQLYRALWNLDDATVQADYESLIPMITEANATYKELDFTYMSPALKTQVTAYGAQLERYLQLIQAAVAANEEEAALLTEISAFTEKWLTVVKLNAITVSAKDQTAIEMMLADFSQLSKPAQQRLQSYKTNGEQLLLLCQSEDEDIKVPDVIEVPADPIIQTTTETVEVPVEVLKTQMQKMIRPVPLLVKLMISFMCIAVLSVFIPITVFFIDSKKQKTIRKEKSQ